MQDHGVYYDRTPAVRAIVCENEDLMLECVHSYLPENGVSFTVETWSGRCSLPPLGLAVEVPGAYFHRVLDILVKEAGVNPSEPYVIRDFARGVEIRTNALTHMLARWNPRAYNTYRGNVLRSLLLSGADANAPALYEVTPLGSAVLTAASQQSLMAFQMVQALPCPPPFTFVADLVNIGGARWREADLPGLFVTAVAQNQNFEYEWHLPLDAIMDFLCPGHGGAVAEELVPKVQGMEASHGMN